jgi:type VI secretion system (T6SS) effector TldE1-like protein
VSARLSDVETTLPKVIDFQRPVRSQIPNNSGMRLASLEMPVSFGDAVEDDPSAFSRSRASSGDRLLPDARLAFFDERFVGAASSGTASVGAAEVGEYGDAPFPYLPDLPEKAAQPTSGRPTPKPGPSSLLASTAKKRIRAADLSPDLNSLQADSHTAIYDIAARTVYLPNGRRLEAHSGLGDLMDDPRYINVKARGPTPPNVYNLTLREELFHGVRAIRLNPVDDGKMFGREGMLAHTYMLGPNGQSNGCVSFSDYPAFLNAYLKGEVDRLVVVDHLANPPASETASGWIPEVIRDFFRRS